jgi:hypothetical protein
LLVDKSTLGKEWVMTNKYFILNLQLQYNIANMSLPQQKILT